MRDSMTLQVRLLALLFAMKALQVNAFLPSERPSFRQASLDRSNTKQFKDKPSIHCSSVVCGIARRDVITTAGSGSVFAALLASSSSSALAASIRTNNGNNNHILVDSPMVRLKLPQAGLGREYVAVKLTLQGKGPFDFMVDTGLTTELITPHLQQSLGISKGRNTIQGLAAGGQTIQQQLVELKGAALCSESCRESDLLRLPTLHAVVTDFPQEHIDPRHDPVEGMLGMELLSLFDVDFDFPNNRIRFCKPGTAARAANAKGAKLVEIPAVVINETGLIGIRVTIQGATQPILGFLDCGSSFSCVNWASAPYLNIPPKTDKRYQSIDKYIQAVGVDGRMLKLPLVRKQVTFAGNPKVDGAGRPTGFEPPSSSFKPWQAVDLGVGDVPAFASILGDGIHPFDGPAALIGLDILSQRRVIFEAGSSPNSRARRVYVSAA
ncbi:hypothetical protein MPSEU_000941800 [Mayamaea pseudoterrestris]|nr:hypothetical protein MPSEU_000941800 [Mayamaea pseudoterrestris]